MITINENEQRRYRDKIGRLQYIRSLSKEIIMPVNTMRESVMEAVMNQDLIEIQEKITEIQYQYDEMNKKIDELVGACLIRDNNTDIVVYDSPIVQKGDKYWEESKGFLGIGKGKMVEKTMK